MLGLSKKYLNMAKPELIIEVAYEVLEIRSQKKKFFV